MSAARDFVLSDTDFDHLRVLVREHTGIHLADTKRELLYGRISRRLRALGLHDFGQYCDLIAGGNEAELEQFSNAITTNLTSFFRESYHFDFLAGELLTQRLAGNHPAKRLRIWSAGCSTGEEAYSIAITLMEAVPGLAMLDARILATDLDSGVLAVAREGVYPAQPVRGLPVPQQKRWFTRARVEDKNNIKVAAELKALICFRRLNLMARWPMRGPFDAIFCRNVLIYFARPTQRKLIDRFAELQRVGDYLFVGHSESLFQITKRYRLVGKTIYQKVC